MIFTISLAFTKEEVLAIGRTLLPNATDSEILVQPTILTTEWAKTTLKRNVKRLMETPDADNG